MMSFVKLVVEGDLAEVAREARKIADAFDLQPERTARSELARLAKFFRLNPPIEGTKIQSIKFVREVYAIGLKEAKDIVEGVSP
jgi:ribosomal protein L7/L12